MNTQTYHPAIDQFSLNHCIVQEIRAETSKIDSFEDGAILTHFQPNCPAAIAWVRNLSTWMKPLPACNHDTNVGLTITHSITPGGSTDRQPGWRDNPETYEVDCAGYAALKLRGCIRAVKEGYGYTSDSLPDELVTDGRVRSRGAVCFAILPTDDKGNVISDTPWMYIYAIVSGGTGEEDKYCAFVGAKRAILKCLCGDKSDNLIEDKSYDPNLAAFSSGITFRPGYEPTTGVSNMAPPSNSAQDTGSFTAVDTVC